MALSRNRVSGSAGNLLTLDVRRNMFPNRVEIRAASVSCLSPPPTYQDSQESVRRESRKMSLSVNALNERNERNRQHSETDGVPVRSGSETPASILGDHATSEGSNIYPSLQELEQVIRSISDVSEPVQSLSKSMKSREACPHSSAEEPHSQGAHTIPDTPIYSTVVKPSKAIVPVEMGRMCGTLRKRDPSAIVTVLGSDNITSPDKVALIPVRPGSGAAPSAPIYETCATPAHVSSTQAPENALPNTQVHENIQPVHQHQVVSEQGTDDFDSFDSTHSNEPSVVKAVWTRDFSTKNTPFPTKLNRKYFSPAVPVSAYEGLGIHHIHEKRRVWLVVTLVFLAALVTAGILATIVYLAAEFGGSVFSSTQATDLDDLSVLEDMKGSTIVIERHFPNLVFNPSLTDPGSPQFQRQAFAVVKSMDDALEYSENPWIRKYFFYSTLNEFRPMIGGKGTTAELTVVFKKGAPEELVRETKVELTQSNH